MILYIPGEPALLSHQSLGRLLLLLLLLLLFQQLAATREKVEWREMGRNLRVPVMN
jgi:hypothetical protein